MSASTISAAQIPQIHDAYLRLVQENGRARDVSQLEKANFTMLRNADVQEAQGVIALYLKGLDFTLKAISKGKLKEFDAVIGDHNCHVSAQVALTAFKEFLKKGSDVEKEVRRLFDFVSTKKGKVHIKSSHPELPQNLIQEAGCAIALSETMQYLVHAAILQAGTECIEHREGGMTLKINPSKIMELSQNKCSLELVKRLIVVIRETVNTASIARVQEMGKIVLEDQEMSCLMRLQNARTNRGENYLYACAFYNMKATLLNLIDQEVPFVLVQYHPQGLVTHAPLIFVQDKEATQDLPVMKQVDLGVLTEDTPIFIFQGFFGKNLSAKEVGRKIEEYGFLRFMLANIALAPQFTDGEEDLEILPKENREEILSYRKEGEELRDICRIAHTYADTFKNLKR